MGIIIVPSLGRLSKNAKVLGYLYINGLDILSASVVVICFLRSTALHTRGCIF